MKKNKQAQRPKCIHRYLQTCKTVELPPGFADFLRGTIALYNYCIVYGYDLYIDRSSHPIFSHFENTFLYNTVYEANACVEIFSSNTWDDLLVEKLFRSNDDITISTNIFYKPVDIVKRCRNLNSYKLKLRSSIIGLVYLLHKKNWVLFGLILKFISFTTSSIKQLENWQDISEETKQYLLELLKPNENLSLCINNAMLYLNICNRQEYEVIHVRSFFLDCDHVDSPFRLNQALSKNRKSIISESCNKIQSLRLRNSRTIFVLLADDDEIALSIIKACPYVRYWANRKSHIGQFSQAKSIDGLMDTLVDFFLMSKSRKIYYLNHSGFSKIASLLFGIPYVSLK